MPVRFKNVALGLGSDGRLLGIATSIFMWACRIIKSVVRRLGKVFRIGYYGRRDGLDCIWLVNSDGVYEQTLDHDFLFKHYEIVMLSDESSLYGVRRPKLPPTRKPNGSKIRKSRSR